MWRHVDRWGWIALLLAVSVGCGSPSSGGSGGQNVSMEELTKQLQKQSGAAAPKPAAPTTPATPAAPANVVAEGRTERGANETAAIDVPADAKRASDKGPQRTQGGYMGAVIGANRNIRERMSDVSWQKSVQLYEASNGRKPRNTEEFLSLVRGEGTPLPEIPDGFTYLYVPDEGQFGELYQVPKDQMPAEPSAGR